MKYMTFPLLLIPLFLCCTSKQYTPVDYPYNQLRFGSGGGFTGEVKEYVLLENGHLFSKSGKEQSYEFMKKLDQDFTTQIFNNFVDHRLEDMYLHEPSNIYSYLEMHTNGHIHRLVWNPQNPIPETLFLYHKILVAQVHATPEPSKN